MTTTLMKSLFFGLLMLLLAVAPAQAQPVGFGDSAEDDGPVLLSIHASKQQARPGDQVIIAVKADISEEPEIIEGKAVHWHIYPPVEIHDAQEIESTFVPTAPEGFVLGQVQWPEPKEIINILGQPQPVYEKQAIVYLPVIVPNDAKPGTYPIQVEFGYQPCRAQCLFPTSENFSIQLEVVPMDADVAGFQLNEAVFAGFDASVWGELQSGEGVYTGSTEQSSSKPIILDLYLFKINLSELGPVALLGLLVAVSLLGGFLLNFTPCVLPVIPLKIMGLSQSAGTRGRTLWLGVVMFGGVLAFWAVFGVFFALLKQFSTVSELFQQWWFTIGVGVIVAAMAVGMCGLFAVRLPQWVYRINPKHDSVLGSFGFGIMTAVLATPCTAPFMGTALAGSTQLQQDWLVMAVFIAIGVGMGLPYLVLAAFPKLVAKVPRTGPGSELLKQVMGLLMLGAAAFFIGTGLNVVMSDGTAPPSKLFWWAVGFFVASAGVWLVWQVIKISPSMAKRSVFTAVGALLLFAGVAGSYVLTRKPPIAWVYYTPQIMQTALAKDKVVVLDFTAAWCNNCHFLEETVLNTEGVIEQLSASDVVPIKVDITSKSNKAGLDLLTEMGGTQIPLLVVLSPDGEQVFKRDWYKPSEVVAAVRSAKGEAVAAR